MRPCELLLAVVVAVAAVPFVVGRPSGRRWSGAAGVGVALTMGTQLLVEGPRWQLAPLYTTAALVTLALLGRLIAARWGGVHPPSTARSASTGRWGSLLRPAAAAVVVVTCVAVPLGVPVFVLPEPEGPYAIGTVTYHWNDPSRAETFTADPADRREVAAQIWYPARHVDGPRAPYVEDPDIVAPGLAQLMHAPEFVFGHLGDVTTHAVEGAPAANAPARFPVLLFASGLSGFRQSNTVQVEHLASHGYVVVALDQPYAAAGVRLSDGRVAPFDTRMSDPAFMYRMLPHLTSDVSMVLDRLGRLSEIDPAGPVTGRLALTDTGVFGVSLGGVVAASACASDPRLHACLVEDAPLPPVAVPCGPTQPTMWISRDPGTMYEEGWSREDVDEHQITMRSVFGRLPGDGYLVLVSGLYHLDLTDATRWSPLLRRLGATGPIGADRAHELVNRYSLGFFDRHLRRLRSPALSGAEPGPGDVSLEVRRAGPPG